MIQVVKKLECLTCGRELNKMDPDGVYLSGHGNWASSVYDPMIPPERRLGFDEYLEVIVCDVCLLGEPGKRVKHISVTEKRPIVKEKPLHDSLPHIQDRRKRLEELFNRRVKLVW